MNRVRKAVFPVAGLGSRFLPATKAQPKEMLPIVDRPLIQYAVEEAVAAGITEMIFITGRNKRAIEDHFDTAYELEAELAASGKTLLLETVQSVIPKNINCIYIRQSAPFGLGHAVLCALPVVGNEPFAVILADDFMDVDPPDQPVMKQMADVHANRGGSVIAVQNVPYAETRQYGIVAATPIDARLEKVYSLVEKPPPEESPSTLAVAGRYILDGCIFSYLQRQDAGAGGEIQLTDAIAAMAKEQTVLAYRYAGRRFDCGSKLGYLQATMAMGLKHRETGSAFRQFLETFR